MPPVPARQMPTRPYQQWQLQDASSALITPAWLQMNRDFYEGDHWQGGAGWVGPRPGTMDAAAVDVMGEISRAFTSQNVIAEIVQRRAAGVIGREPTWSLVPRTLSSTTRDGSEGRATDADTALIGEAMDLLTVWWDQKHVHELLQVWLEQMLWAERATLRGFVPPGLLVPVSVDGVAMRGLRVADATDALRQWFLHMPTPEAAEVYTNPETMQEAGVYLYQRGNEQRAELVYVDEATGLTIQRTLGGGLTAQPTRLNLGRRLTMHEATHPPFITQQIRQMQRAYNFALSMVPRNLATGGFLEMVVLNGMMPGHYEDDATSPTGRRFVRHPTFRGAGVTNWIAGIETGQDQDGNSPLTTPSVQWRPPVTVDVAADDELYKRMLQTAQQVHVLMNSDANASGISREQARAEFRNSLRQPRIRVQHAGRWLIETALAWVEFATGQPGKFTGRLRCDFQCMLDTGVASVEERAQNVAEFEANLLSDDTAMERNGVEDVDAERTRIAGSSRALLALGKNRAETVAMWLDTGLSFVAACVASGMDEADARKIEKLSSGDSVDPNANPVPPNTGNPFAKGGDPAPAASA